MFPYWLMFILPAVAAVFPQKSSRTLQLFLLLLTGIFYSIIIGLRHDVGADWFNYLGIYEMIASPPLGSAVNNSWGGGDLGYIALNQLMSFMGLGIYGVNLVCGAVFMSGVIAFAYRQPFPWLAIGVAVPYLIVVVAMGYTRQSVALGLVFWGMAILRDGHILRYAMIIVIAALFHKSAVLMLPFGFLVSSARGRWSNIFILGGSSIIFAIVFLQAHYESLWHQYVEADMVSEGGEIRLLMNVAAAGAMFIFWKRWKRAFPDYKLWFWVALLSIACLGLVGFASTAVDRVALYLAPLQIVVYSRLPILIQDTMLRTVAVIAIISGYAAVLWVWLNHANHAFRWLPYDNLLFQW